MQKIEAVIQPSKLDAVKGMAPWVAEFVPVERNERSPRARGARAPERAYGVFTAGGSTRSICCRGEAGGGGGGRDAWIRRISWRLRRRPRTGTILGMGRFFVSKIDEAIRISE